MKTTFFTTMVIAMVFASCNQSDINEKEYEVTLSSSIRTVTIDSCEYVVYDVSRGGNIIHKENCKFCQQRKK
ncbi:hypothetical protein [Flavobacterium cerinum]|uniref:Uncharacterized protein n=1 Tax=Flavobacterium cerinum TaxID=2502784 RepID=A0ABY5IRS6_9FLAO|nr:hypothetical protein [Flavobacterium cerinum]UUC45570.1 hypothetical protein NOX80_18360 [Flavobacterium cerinum]